MEKEIFGVWESDRKVAVVTGASRGIGAAVSDQLGAAGYQLVLSCLYSYPDLLTLCEQLSRRYGIACQAVQADAGSFQEMEALFTGLDRLDVLVNNAGISHVGLLSEMSPAEWDRVLSVNLSSCFYTSRQAIPLMLRKHHGRIIQISSVWGNVGASMEVAYSASKGGMNAFTKALAKELAPSQISVNAIACGVIDTAMNACFSGEDLDILRQEIPADRLGTPEEVARMVMQLVDAPDYLTGQVITLDGGWT